MVSRSHVAFLNNWARSFFLHIVFVRRKMPDVTDDHSKTTRSEKMASRWLHEGQDGLTNSIRKRTYVRPSGDFLTCQRLCATHKLAAGA